MMVACHRVNKFQFRMEKDISNGWHKLKFALQAKTTQKAGGK